MNNGIGSIEGLKPSSSVIIGVGATSIPIGDKGQIVRAVYTESGAVDYIVDRVSMLWDALHFFVNLVEVIVAVALILIAGLTVARIAFWILSRILGKFAGPATGSDPYEDEIDDYVAIPSPPDDTSIPTEDGR